MRPAQPATTDPAIVVVPANEATWEDIAAIFGTRGEAAACWCQRYKLAPREAFRSWPAEARADRLRRQTGCGDPSATATTGLVASLGGVPAGWCAVEPRAHYEGLRRVYRVPWLGRDEDKADTGVWAVTCLFTRAGYRRQGVSRALARAAVAFARERGARALEGYPMATAPGEDIAWGELHVGSRSVFADAGFREVGRPTPRRFVMRIAFAGATTI
jgi:GNAT superfamily N-acetyltransferase